MHTHFGLPFVTCEELFALRICLPHPTRNCKYIPNLHRLQVNLASFSSVGTSVQCRQGKKSVFQMHLQADILHICACTIDMHGCACKCCWCKWLHCWLRTPTLHGNAHSAQLQLPMLCICAFPRCMVTRALGNCSWLCCASAHSHIAW